MQITTIGLDIAKNVFQVHGIDASEKVVVRKQLRRSQVLAFFKALPPCLIGMEACATAHYWARELTKLGHTVRLMPAKDVLRPGSGSCRGKIPPGASRSSGRPRNRAIAICDAFWWWEPMRSCATRGRTLKNIPGSLSFWPANRSRSWRWRWPTKSRASPGRCRFMAAPIERLRQRRKQGVWRGEDEAAYVRSRTAGVMTTLMRNGRDRRSENPFGATRGRTRAPVWDRSADHIRASGRSGCIALRQVSKRKQAGYMAAPGRFAKRSDFSLAPRAPSIHGPKCQFAAVQRYGCCRSNTGRSVDVADTDGPDPKPTWLARGMSGRDVWRRVPPAPVLDIDIHAELPPHRSALS
jgi:hypothetical protein